MTCQVCGKNCKNAQNTVGTNKTLYVPGNTKSFNQGKQPNKEKNVEETEVENLYLSMKMLQVQISKLQVHISEFNYLIKNNFHSFKIDSFNTEPNFVDR